MANIKITELENPGPTQKFKLTGTYVRNYADFPSSIKAGSPMHIKGKTSVADLTVGVVGDELSIKTPDGKILWSVTLDASVANGDEVTIDHIGVRDASDTLIYTFFDAESEEEKTAAIGKKFNFRVHLHNTDDGALFESMVEIVRGRKQSHSSVSYFWTSDKPSEFSPTQDYHYVPDPALVTLANTADAEYGPTRMLYGETKTGSRTVFVMEMSSDGTASDLIGSGIDPATRDYSTKADGTFTFKYRVGDWHMLAYDSTKTTLHLTTARSIKDQALTIDFTNTIDFEVIDIVLLNSSADFIGFKAADADPAFYTDARLVSVSFKGESVVLAIAFDIAGKIAIQSSQDVAKLLTDASISEKDLKMNKDTLIKFNIASGNFSDRLNGKKLLLGKPIRNGFEVNYDMDFD
jgi:hypothetical protein